MRCKLVTQTAGFRLVARKCGQWTARHNFTTYLAWARAALAYNRAGYIIAQR